MMNDKLHGRRRIGRVMALAVALATAGTFMLATGAEAATAGSVSCGNGALAAGSYRNVTVTGTCVIGAGAEISGNIAVAAGKVVLDGAEVGGNVSVAPGAILYAAGATIHGNVSASRSLALYVFGSTLEGNLSFTGGGYGPACMNPTALEGQGHNTMVKDSHIGGNVVFDGWSGCWFGFLRNTVDGNVRISNMYANPENVIEFMGFKIFQGLDSTEVVGNHVSGVLDCRGNTPAAQVGDAQDIPNTAARALGECAALT